MLQSFFREDFAAGRVCFGGLCPLFRADAFTDAAAVDSDKHICLFTLLCVRSTVVAKLPQWTANIRR